MIHLTLTTRVSLHKRDLEARAALVEEIKAQLRGPLEKRLYHVRVVVKGDFFLPDGRPRRRDSDNIVYTVFNCIAKAGGLDDSYLNHDFCVHVEQGNAECIEVTLT
jgi:Holliday junction resolvase RusA-like endonuclease